MERCNICNKTYDACRCAEYAEAEKKRTHEMTLREKYCNLGDKAVAKLKVVLIVAIISGSITGIIASLAKAIATGGYS